jgi:hypothetical protein
MSTTITSSYNGSPALGATIFVQIRNPATGAVLLSRTNGGIREDIASSGFYTWQGTISTDLDSYEAIWDEAAASYAGEIVVPRPSVNVTVNSPNPVPVQGDANGVLSGLTFLIKRGDTKPYLRRQLTDTGGNAIVLAGTETIKFTMRASTDVAMTGSAKIHASAVIIDAPTGIVEYQWTTGDTDTTTYAETSTLGRPTDTPYAAEFEVNFADGTVETFPQGTYIAVSIPPDLDPGVTP